jgi:hypothetical protein
LGSCTEHHDIDRDAGSFPAESYILNERLRERVGRGEQAGTYSLEKAAPIHYSIT